MMWRGVSQMSLWPLTGASWVNPLDGISLFLCVPRLQKETSIPFCYREIGINQRAVSRSWESANFSHIAK